MKVRSQILNPFVIRGIAIICAAGFVISGHAARAGINVWTNLGLGGDSIRALVIEPLTPSTLYAGTDGGTDRGVFQRTNSGGSWSAANTGLAGGGSVVSALVLDPTTQSTLFAGTGGGVFKSTDGSTWSAANMGLAGSGWVRALALDPTTPTTLFAGTDGGGVFKSTDGGGTWNAANTGLGGSGSVSALVLDPATLGTLFAGTDGGGVFKSTDGGGTWSAAAIGLPGAGSVSALALDPTMPGTLYAGTMYFSRSGCEDCYGGVFKSIDAGSTWSGVRMGLPGNGVNCLALDPTAPGTLYAGTDYGVFKSADSGGSWQPVTSAGLTNPFVSVLVLDPTSPGTLYAGTGGGVFSIQQVPAAKVVGTGTAASCTDAALDAALAGGGVVTFDCGPDPASIDISTGTGTKTIAADTIIDGGGLITISGGGVVSVFRVDSAVNFTVENLTIANGYAIGSPGGGIDNGGSLTVTNSVFARNSASFGGGIENNGTLTVTNSTFSDNNAFGSGGMFPIGGQGGGIHNRSTLTLTNSTFSGNSTSCACDGGGRGGAIANNGGTLTVTNSSILDGDIFSDNGGTLSVTSSTVGYIGNFGGTLTATNSTVTFGIYTSNYGTLTSSTTVINSTVTGSIDNSSGGSLTVTNTIVANSTNCFGQITDGGHNIDDGTSCGFTTANDSLSNTDPQLDPAGLKNNGGPTQTVALCTALGVPAGCPAASPAIDAGDQAVCAAAPVNDRDQRGLGRPGIGHTQCSIGAYEADAIQAPACTGDCDGTGSVTVDETISLVDIALGNAEPAACVNGVPSGADVNVAVIIQAVNSALSGCGSGQ